MTGCVLEVLSRKHKYLKYWAWLLQYRGINQTKTKMVSATVVRAILGATEKIKRGSFRNILKHLWEKESC